MPAKRLSMRKISKVLRLKASGMSHRKIAQSCGVSRPTVGEYLQRASRVGVAWPLVGLIDRLRRPLHKSLTHKGWAL